MNISSLSSLISPSTPISPKVIKSEAGPNNPRVKKRNCGNKRPHMQGICSLSVIHTPFTSPYTHHLTYSLLSVKKKLMLPLAFRSSFQHIIYFTTYILHKLLVVWYQLTAFISRQQSMHIVFI